MHNESLKIQYELTLYQPSDVHAQYTYSVSRVFSTNKNLHVHVHVFVYGG